MYTSRFARRRDAGLRRLKFVESGGKCQKCGAPITEDNFHLAHLRAASHGGPAISENLEAWCVACNLANGACDVRDTRLPLREWQRLALPIALEKITLGRVATVMAAPGAGKTLFAGVLFAVGQEAGLWERILVFVPRLPLVEQWKDRLVHDYHIALDTADGARSSGVELDDMDGVAMTYQALLTPAVRERHRMALKRTPTLVVLDEVHHLGEPVHDGMETSAWSKNVRELVGDLRTTLNVRGVLNLSGTLFRTSPAERIATVHYLNIPGPPPRIQAIADYEIQSGQLVKEGLLRSPDLFRLGARVEISDSETADVTESAIADLTEPTDSRLVLRELNKKPEWVRELVRVTLEQLEKRHRDSKFAPVKALIVAARQEQAREFAAEVDRQMVARNLQPLAECVVSDDGDEAYRRLDDFRQKNRVGVLVTVGMAGEGYDCPDICVITYASNIMTPQYVRQVVARAQRVTAWERERLGHPLTTAIILPDVQDLVALFKSILAPMVHELDVPAAPAAPDPRERGGEPVLPWHSRDVVSVRDAALEIISAVNSDGSNDIDPNLVDLLTPHLRNQNLPESLAPRILIAMKQAEAQRPFDAPLIPTATVLTQPAHAPAQQRPMTSREHADAIRAKLTIATGWWAAVATKQGGEPVGYFYTAIYQAVGIKSLDHATPDQLQRAVAHANTCVRRFCERHSLAVPRWARA